MGGLPELPEGPVTIMFTDIVDSTATRTALGDAECNALFAEHGSLVRDQIARHHGFDQGAALGDGFLAVFPSTRRAVACAIAIQDALDTFNGGRTGPPLRVRIGLNTGEVGWQDGQLSGEAVHAAARVCSSGTGGQILVSDVTRQLVGTVPDVSFRDAGEFELKGFPQPWRLWEVVWVRTTTAAPAQVFVGRDAELGVLRSKLVSALDGHGGLVLVGGEPGVGKTTLVRRLIQEAEHRGALPLFGRCYESDGTVPYAPFIEMLEQALAVMPPDMVRADMGDDAPEVARMVPELRRRFPDIGDPLDLPPEQQRRYFFNAVGSFVSRGSARFPLLLVLDDVHWADESTLLLTEHIAALMPGLRVLGVGTYRDVELDVTRPLSVSMERLVRDRLVVRLSVRRFDRATVAEMLGRLADQPAPDAVVDAIFDETEGNPFFVEEVFRHLHEEGRLFEDGRFRDDIEVGELDVPESVRLVVGRRLARLGPDAHRILAAGAVVGRAFPFRLLEEIADAEPSTLLDVVEAAEAARVIVAEERDGEVRYSFGHELIRQTLLSGLSVLRRQRLHLAVADAIERIDKRARRDRPSEIAHHLLAAGAAAEPERTLEYLEAAVARALDAAAFEEAVRAVDDALTVVDDDDDLRVARLRERRGWAVRALGRFDEAIAAWDGVADAYVANGLDEEAAALYDEIGYQLVWLNRFDEMFAAYNRALAIIGDQRTATAARSLALIGGFLGIAGFYQQAEEKLREAEAIAREVGDDRALGRVLWGWSMAQWSNSRAGDAIVTGRAAMEHLRRANDLWALTDALAWTSFPLILAGTPETCAEGIRLADEGVELGRRLGHRGGEVLARRGALMGALVQGGTAADFAAAATVDLAGFTSIGSPWRSQSYALLASAAIRQGDPTAALWCAAEAIELEPVSAWSGVAWAFALLAHAWLGDVEECGRLVDEGRDRLPAPGELEGIGRTVALNAVVEASVVAGLPDRAAAVYPLVAERVDRLTMNPFDVSCIERFAGMAAAAARRWDEAAGHFERALVVVAGVGAVLERPTVEHWYGEMLLDRGRPEDVARGRTLLESAVAGYTAVGMPMHAERAKARLAGEVVR